MLQGPTDSAQGPTSNVLISLSSVYSATNPDTSPVTAPKLVDNNKVTEEDTVEEDTLLEDKVASVPPVLVTPVEVLEYVHFFVWLPSLLLLIILDGSQHLSRDCTSTTKCFNCGGTDGHC